MSVAMDRKVLENAAELSANIVEAIQLANTLPENEDLAFFKALYTEQARQLNHCSLNVLKTLNRLLGHIDPSFNEFTDEDDALERYLDIVDVNDNLLEIVVLFFVLITDLEKDANLDKLNGIVANKADQLPQITPVMMKLPIGESKKNSDYLRAANVIRPQLSFPDKIDNSNTTPFVPKLKEKVNALVPWEYRFMDKSDGVAWQDHFRSLGLNARKSIPHPYQYEIENCNMIDMIKEIKEPQKSSSLEKPALWIDEPSQLESLLQELCEATEIAVDLEAHDHRTFQGFTCLMQISTRANDYLIDTLKLRGELQCLNKVFTDPRIIKVYFLRALNIRSRLGFSWCK